MILGVEPEYAFDVPSREWFRTWYAMSNGILVGSLLAVLVACAMMRLWTKRWPTLCGGPVALAGAWRFCWVRRVRRFSVAGEMTLCSPGPCRSSWPFRLWLPSLGGGEIGQWQPHDSWHSVVVAAFFVLSCCRVLLDVSPSEPGDRMGISVWFHGRDTMVDRRSVLVPAISGATPVGGHHDFVGFRRLLLVRRRAAGSQALIKFPSAHHGFHLLVCFDGIKAHASCERVAQRTGRTWRRLVSDWCPRLANSSTQS